MLSVKVFSLLDSQFLMYKTNQKKVLKIFFENRFREIPSKKKKKK